MLACAVWAVRAARAEVSGARQESRDGIAWVLGEAKRLHEDCERRRAQDSEACERRLSDLERRMGARG
jgi:hypothetical protein